MEVVLFRALTKANIDADTAQQVVDALEEHIDMAVGQANKALELKLDAMKTGMDARFDGIKSGMDGIKSGVDQMRTWLIIITSIIAICALFGMLFSTVVQFIK